MNLTPNTNLKRAPNLKVQILEYDGIIIFKRDQWIRCKSHGLAVLDIFAQPVTVTEAFSILKTRFSDPRDRAQVIDVIDDLYGRGFLQDEGQRSQVSDPVNPGEAFACFLNEQPSRLLPHSGRILKPSAVGGNGLVINKRIHIQTGAESPARLMDPIPTCERFLSGHPLLWVQDPGTRILAPYWLNNAEVELIQGLITGKISPFELDQSKATMLANANVLVPSDYEESQLAEWKQTCSNLFIHQQSEQYAIVRGIIHPLQIAALRRYFRTLDHKNFLLPDTQGASLRYAWHNEKVAQFIHHQLSNLVKQITRQPIKPSYSYLSLYKSGAFLAKHKDRPQCSWNLSLLIDTDPERDLSDSWPIFLEVGKTTKEVRLEMGDGVLYQGTEVLHWREAIANGETTTLILCHFVPEDFAGSLV